MEESDVKGTSGGAKFGFGYEKLFEKFILNSDRLQLF